MTVVIFLTTILSAIVITINGHFKQRLAVKILGIVFIDFLRDKGHNRLPTPPVRTCVIECLLFHGFFSCFSLYLFFGRKLPIIHYFISISQHNTCQLAKTPYAYKFPCHLLTPAFREHTCEPGVTFDNPEKE
jgi:hypothetical protein